MEYFLIFGSIGRMVERQHMIPNFDTLNRFGPVDRFDHRVFDKALVCNQHFEFVPGMFGDVLGNRPAPAGELEQGRTADSLSPNRIAMFITRQPSIIIQFVTEISALQKRRLSPN